MCTSSADASLSADANLVDSLAHDVFNVAQGVKGSVSFLWHYNGKAYIITAEKPNSVFRKVIVKIYEAGGRDPQNRNIGSLNEAIEKGLLNPTNDEGFHTIFTKGARLLGQFEVKNSFSKKKMKKKIRKNILKLKLDLSSNKSVELSQKDLRAEDHSIFQNDSKNDELNKTKKQLEQKVLKIRASKYPQKIAKNKPETVQIPVVDHPSPKVQTPKKMINPNDPFGIGYEGDEKSRRGVLDELKEHLEQTPLKKRFQKSGNMPKLEPLSELPPAAELPELELPHPPQSEIDQIKEKQTYWINQGANALDLIKGGLYHLNSINPASGAVTTPKEKIKAALKNLKEEIIHMKGELGYFIDEMRRKELQDAVSQCEQFYISFLEEVNDGKFDKAIDNEANVNKILEYIENEKKALEKALINLHQEKKDAIRKDVRKTSDTEGSESSTSTEW
ncbi:MAG: hypothetical protein LBF44_02635 [Holosporaceae bacterium]|jgi:hypothetical protein|nr:hypothetical protein [Holosporaceae bacterium]